ncbi:unnamed protein product [Soboliphyme baturini]|uniref:Uncharacterized protein n=1 Tax=Soboliphyme baturini TaxID=241478 RepID=A0A3P8DGS1_9BILA|nr:unnamed protein product [Soboliphyme baturini]
MVLPALTRVTLLGKSLRECQKIYIRLKDQLFDGRKRPYDSETLTKFIKDEIGAETTLADITGKRFIITTVMADKHPIRLHLFRNYTLPVDTEVAANLRFDDPKGEIRFWLQLFKSSNLRTLLSNELTIHCS